MKTLIREYVFDASAGTVTFTGKVSIALENVLMIINVVGNVIIYNFADPAKGGSVNTNVLTLGWDTSLMSDTDELQVWYWEDGESTKLAVNSVDSTITYVGKAAMSSLSSSSVWQIKRLTETGSNLDIEWADGDAFYDNIWDNREALSYG